MRKAHLQYTAPGRNGPACQGGRSGGSLRGEHITEPYAEFIAERPEVRCVRCSASKIFAFYQRKTA